MLGAVILQVILIALNAICASAEIAVISMNDVKLNKLAEEGDKRAAKLVTLTAQPARFLATIQVSITLAGFLGSAYAADNFAKPLVAMLINLGLRIPESVLNSVCVFLITIIIAYFSIVFGELIPKRVAMQNKEAIALSVANLLYLVSKVFKPLVALLTGSTNLILKIMGINPEQEEEVTEEEIRMMLAAGNENGTIDSDETRMIENVFEMDDQSIAKIYTHRKDVIGLNLEDNMMEWDRIIKEFRHNCLPVYQETLDDIRGVLDVKTYFRLKDKSREKVLTQAVRKPYFVSEQMKADVLVNHMRQRREYFAIAVDEYGGTAGVISIKDLMEIVIGDMPDKHEKTNNIFRLEADRFLIQGNATLEDLSEAFGIVLQSEQYDTFNGLVCDLLGGVPTDQCKKHLENDRLIIDIKGIQNFCVERAIVRIKETEIATTDEI